MDASTPILRVGIDLSVLLGNLRAAIQHIIDVVAYGLSRENDRPPPLGIPGAFMSYGTAGNLRLSGAQLDSEYRTWLVGAGLRDAVETVSAFLEEVRRAAAAARFAVGSQPIDTDEWNKIFGPQESKFHRLGLPDKLDELRRFGAELVPNSAESLLQVNQLRNCLVHRRGIVTERDLNQATALEVSWHHFVVGIEQGDEFTPLRESHLVREGEQIVMKTTSTTREFVLGERVILSAQEFGELCYSLSLFGQEVVKGFETYLGNLGIPVKLADETEAQA